MSNYPSTFIQTATDQCESEAQAFSPLNQSLQRKLGLSLRRHCLSHFFGRLAVSGEAMAP